MALDNTLIDQLVKDYRRPEEITGAERPGEQCTKKVLTLDQISGKRSS